MQPLEYNTFDAQAAPSRARQKPDHRQPNGFFTGLFNAILLSLPGWAVLIAVAVWIR
jgi:hypothetical protein